MFQQLACWLVGLSIVSVVGFTDELVLGQAPVSEGLNSWSEFRGTSGAHAVGHHPPMEWSDTQNIEWRVPIQGLGWSSPSVHRGVVYLTTAVPLGPGLSLRAMAFDAQSGKSLWDIEVKRVEKVPSIHAKNSHASPTPIVRDDAVYVHFGTLGTAKLRPIDGKIEWLCEELDYPPVHGSGGSPVLRDNKLAIICDGSANPFVCALDAGSGKVVWKTPRSVSARISHSFGTVAMARVEGRTQVLAPGPDHMAAYDLEDGKELWKVLAPGWSVVPQPILIDDMVIYNHDYDNPELMAVRLGGQGDVTQSHVVWRSARGAPSTPTPLLVGAELYFVSDNGIVSCVDAKTGERHWMERLGGNYSASPVYVNDLLLFLSEDGLATWVKPSVEYTVAGKNQITGRTLATPSFFKDSMFLRTEEYLLKISQQKN